MPHTLLLADDSVTIQRVIELTFADEDVKVIAVGDGDQAIERLEAAPPDIVLADIGMPGKNGYEVARYIKQSPKLSHIPVVLLTGAFEPVDQARATEAGCDGVLAKPFEPQLVIGRVKDLLAKSQHAPLPSTLDDDLAPPPTPAVDRWETAAVDQQLSAAPSAPAETIPALDDYFDRLDAAFQTLGSPAAAPAPSGAAEPSGFMPPAPPPPHDVPSAETAPDIDWFNADPNSSAPASETWDLSPGDIVAPATEPADLALSYGSSESAFDAAPSPRRAVEAVAEAPAPPVEAPPAWHVAEPFPASAASAAPPMAEEPPLAAPPHEEAPPVAAVPVAAAPAAEPVKVAALPTLADAFAALLAAEEGEAPPMAIPAWPANGPSSDELVEQVARRVLDRLSDRVVRDTVSQLVSEVAERLVREEIEKIKASIK